MYLSKNDAVKKLEEYVGCKVFIRREFLMDDAYGFLFAFDQSSRAFVGRIVTTVSKADGSIGQLDLIKDRDKLMPNLRYRRIR